MKSSTLHIRWPNAKPQAFPFSSIEDAIDSAVVICYKFGQETEVTDPLAIRNKLSAGEVVNRNSFSMQIETVEFNEHAFEASTVPEPEVTGDPLFHYVLMRQDVPDYLSGKAMAQANHAGTAMVLRGQRTGKIDLLTEIDEWAAEADGFGTCIVLLVTSAEMRQAVSIASLMGVWAGIVHDPTYPLRDGDRFHTLPVDTCAFVFGRKSVCQPVVKGFPLLRGPGEK